jgi:hypothetical protein
MQSISGTTATQAVTTVALRTGTLSGPLERDLATSRDLFPETVFMHQVRQLVFARAIICGVLAFGMLLAALAWGAADETLPSGTVEINQTRVAFLVSGNTGGGVLHYRGRDYPFSIGGLGIGGIGVTKLTARGEVYNLSSPSQFAGMYSQLRTGMTLGDTGHGRLWLKNGDGVVLKLRGDSKGMGLTMGADAVHISFK